MLTWDTVLMYIKGRLSLPSTFIEKSDQELKNWLTITSIPDFSNYFPDDEFTSVITDNSNYQVPGRTSHYRFFDEDNLDIYSIKQCFFPMGDAVIAGHPPFGAWSFEGMSCWSLQVFKSRFFMPFSQWSKTYKFVNPNMVHVLPETRDMSSFVVHYEREQPHDLRKVPATLKRIFMELCLADTMLWLGSIRSHYGGGRLTTPFGEIPLEGDTLKTDGEALRDKTIDKLAEETLPPVVIDIT